MKVEMTDDGNIVFIPTTDEEKALKEAIHKNPKLLQEIHKARFSDKWTPELREKYKEMLLKGETK